MTYLRVIGLARGLPCLADLGRIIVIGRSSKSLDDVMPYLATLPSVIAYSPAQCILTVRRQPGVLTPERDQVYITQVRDVQEGLGLLAALTQSINAVWEHRQELVAVTVPKRTPRPLDVCALLPQANCRQCQEATCMAFAVTLLQNSRTLSECPVLASDPHRVDRRAALNAML